MKPYLLKETNWKTIRDIEFDLAVLPWGATEAHNLHLPYGTDIYEADYFSEAAAQLAWERGAKVVVLPAIPFGVNTGQAEVLLDINMNSSTHLAILGDIITVLDRQGIRKLLILNSHGGNEFKSLLRELGLKFPQMFLSTCNWYQSVDKKQFFDVDGDHAGEMETSLMMHLVPELVLPISEAGPGNEKKSTIAGFVEKWAWTERKWTEITEDTGIGDPRHATPEKGKRYYNAVTRKLADLMVDLAGLRDRGQTGS
ncbi:MAG: creatininase family protein [Spirochaetaceae bacterium]|nr:creatininase family protein [Spirochaetaceae bacterium]